MKPVEELKKELEAVRANQAEALSKMDDANEADTAEMKEASREGIEKAKATKDKWLAKLVEIETAQQAKIDVIAGRLNDRAAERNALVAAFASEVIPIETDLAAAEAELRASADVEQLKAQLASKDEELRQFREAIKDQVRIAIAEQVPALNAPKTKKA